LVLLASACGRIGFAPTAADDARPTDGQVADVMCSAWGPFGSPVHVPELATAMDDKGPTLSADQLAIVFDANTDGTFNDLWGATRSDVSQPFDPPTQLGLPNEVGQSDDNGSLSSDGRRLYFSSDRTGAPRIFITTRSSTSQPFGPATVLGGGLLTTMDAIMPALSPDERTVYFAGYSGTSYDLYVATRPDESSDFGTPMEVAGLTTGNQDWMPSISSDGLELYFATDRNIGSNMDIYVSRRASTTAMFSTATPLAGLSSAALSESHPSISYDGTTLWFTLEDGPQSAGGEDIYYATRACQ
jgi:Tol biopolymer transport system component